MKGKFTRHAADIVTHRIYNNQGIHSYYLEASSALESERSNSDLTTVVHRRSCGFKRNPPQVQHPLRIARAMREFSGTTLPERALAVNNEAMSGVKRCNYQILLDSPV